MYIHDVLVEEIMSYDATIEIGKFHETLISLNKINTDTHTTGLENQFMVNK